MAYLDERQNFVYIKIIVRSEHNTYSLVGSVRVYKNLFVDIRVIGAPEKVVKGYVEEVGDVE